MPKLPNDVQSATSTQLVRDLQSIKDMLLHGPVHITTHGREDFVLVSQKDYRTLDHLKDTNADRLNAKLELVMDSIETLITIMDDNMVVRRVNKAWLSYFDKQADQIVGRSLADQIKTPNDNFIYQRTKNVCETRMEETFEMPSSHMPGRLFRFVIRPWPRGVAMFATDITERNRAAERIMRDEAMDQSIKFVDGVGVAAIDDSGKFVTVTKSLAELVGTTPDAMVGTSLLTLIDPQSRAEVEQALANRSTETHVMEISYLRRGTQIAQGRLALTAYSSSQFSTCYALALSDPNWSREARETTVA